MKLLRTVLSTLASIAFFCPNPARADYTPPPSNHVDLNFNYDWKFIKEDVKGGAQAQG